MSCESDRTRGNGPDTCAQLKNGSFMCGGRVNTATSILRLLFFTLNKNRGVDIDYASALTETHSHKPILNTAIGMKTEYL